MSSPPECDWQQTWQERGPPSPSEIHVWRILLEADPREVEAVVPWLSDDEQQRAERLRTEVLRRRFVVCRAAQRAILAHYLDADPGKLRFDYGPHGKPSLNLTCDSRQLVFNVSNSHELALCAVGTGETLGIDVEHLRLVRSMKSLVRHYFAEREIATLESLPADRQLDAFFAAWTRKESLLKAVGSGLSFPLRDVEVTLAPQEPAQVVRFGGGADGTGGWHLTSFTPAPGYLAALAHRIEPPRISYCSWAIPTR